MRFLFIDILPASCFTYGMKRNKSFLSFSGKILAVFFVVGFALSSCATSEKNKGENFIADVDPIELSPVTAQFSNFLGTAIEPKVVSVFFVPRSNEVLLEYKVTGNIYKLYLNREARDLIRKAAVQYNADFDAVKLDRDLSYRKSERIYGEAKNCHMEWGLSSFTMNGEAYPKVVAGYRFEGRNPYFVVVVPVTENLGYKEGRSGMQNTVKQVIYMNKAQALALADVLDENNLLSSLSTVVVPVMNPDGYSVDGGKKTEPSFADDGYGVPAAESVPEAAPADGEGSASVENGAGAVPAAETAN